MQLPVATCQSQASTDRHQRLTFGNENSSNAQFRITSSTDQILIKSAKVVLDSVPVMSYTQLLTTYIKTCCHNSVFLVSDITKSLDPVLDFTVSILALAFPNLGALNYSIRFTFSSDGWLLKIRYIGVCACAYAWVCIHLCSCKKERPQITDLF